jgi:hypothetical protein
MKRLVFPTTLALGIALLTPLTATADDLECAGTLGAVQVDNVIVPAGATCNLAGTRVQGNIKVGTNATLVTNTALINGNVQGDGFRNVFLGVGTEVRGNVELKHGRRTDIRNSVLRQNLVLENNRAKIVVRVTSVGGNLQAFKNSGKLQLISNPIIGGDLQVFEHAGRVKINQNLVDQDLQVFKNFGLGTLRNNVIRGNLQCKENIPAVGASGNVVGGNNECEQ